MLFCWGLWLRFELLMLLVSFNWDFVEWQWATHVSHVTALFSCIFMITVNSTSPVVMFCKVFFRLHGTLSIMVSKQNYVEWLLAGPWLLLGFKISHGFCCGRMSFMLHIPLFQIVPWCTLIYCTCWHFQPSASFSGRIVIGLFGNTVPKTAGLMASIGWDFREKR